MRYVGFRDIYLVWDMISELLSRGYSIRFGPCAPRDLGVQQGLQHLAMPIYQRSLTTIGALLVLFLKQGLVGAFVLAPGQTAASGVVPSCTSTFDVQPKSNNGNSWDVKLSLASATNAAGESITSADEAKRHLKEVLEKNSRRTRNGDVKSAIEILRGFNPTAEPAKAWHLLNGEWVAVGYEFPEMTFTPEGLECTLGRLAFNIFEPVSLPVRIVKIINSARPRDPFAASSDVAENWNPYDLTTHFCSRDGSELRGKVVLKGSCTTDPEDPKRLLVRFSSSVIEPEDVQDLKAWRSVIGLSRSRANSSKSIEKTKFRAFATLRKRVGNLTPKILMRSKPRVKEPESRGELTHEMPRSPKCWTDVLYVDEEMRITCGNRGSVVVAIRE